MEVLPEYKLKDIGCSLLSGFAFKSSDYSLYGIPLIKIGNIQNRIVTIDKAGDCVSDDIVNNKISKYFLEDGDVLIAMTGQGSVGRVGRLKLKGATKPLLNQRVGKFLCDEAGINLDYLYYVLSSDKYQEILFHSGSGSGQPNLSPEIVLDTEIPVPKYEVQKAIAEVLLSLDDKIDLLERQNRTLEQLAETLFRQWFVEEPHESWQEKSLDEIAEFLNGLACQKFRPQQNEGRLPVIKIKEMKTGITKSSDFATSNVPQKYIVKDGDLLFSWSGSLDVMLWFGGNGVLNQHLFKVTSQDFPQWLCYFWIKYHLDEFKGIAEDKSTTMGHIQRHHLSQAKVFIPNSKELEKMDRVIDPVFKKLKSNQIQIRTLTRLRDALLPKLISGEMEVGI